MSNQQRIEETFASIERSIASFKEVIDQPQSVQRAVNAAVLHTLTGMLEELCVPRKRRKRKSKTTTDAS